MTRKFMVAGNWKLNGSLAANAELINGIETGMKKLKAVDVVVCPPACYLESVAARASGTGIKLGAQNVSHVSGEGAYTGEVNTHMLSEVGCDYIIVGHSERRSLYGESSEVVAHKVRAVLDGKLTPILCLGETLEQRESGKTETVLSEQLDAVINLVGIDAFSDIVIAYEPVWAIGTGKTATPEQAQETHAFLRARLAQNNATISQSVRILYGGSVKPDNAKILFSCSDVDGGLIGGASLKANDFLAICDAAQSLSA